MFFFSTKYCASNTNYLRRNMIYLIQWPAFRSIGISNGKLFFEQSKPKKVNEFTILCKIHNNQRRWHKDAAQIERLFYKLNTLQRAFYNWRTTFAYFKYNPIRMKNISMTVCCSCRQLISNSYYDMNTWAKYIWLKLEKLCEQRWIWEWTSYP